MCTILFHWTQILKAAVINSTTQSSLTIISTDEVRWSCCKDEEGGKFPGETDNALSFTSVGDFKSWDAKYLTFKNNPFQLQNIFLCYVTLQAHILYWHKVIYTCFPCHCEYNHTHKKLCCISIVLVWSNWKKCKRFWDWFYKKIYNAGNFYHQQRIMQVARYTWQAVD